MKNSLKRNADIIAMALVWLVVSISVCIFLQPDKYNIIQSELVVTLVFVTFYYAIQTYKLADYQKELIEENKRKSDVDFYEKIIRDFYNPLENLLNEFENYVSSVPAYGKDPVLLDKNILDNKFRIIFDFLKNNRQLISNDTYKKIFDINISFRYEIRLSRNKDLGAYVSPQEREKIFSASEELKQLIFDERSRIGEKIRKYYEI